MLRLLCLCWVSFNTTPITDRHSTDEETEAQRVTRPGSHMRGTELETSLPEPSKFLLPEPPTLQRTLSFLPGILFRRVLPPPGTTPIITFSSKTPEACQELLHHPH